MTRGTTTEIVCTVEDSLEDITELYVTVKQGKVSVEKSLDDALIDGHHVHIMLTQDETLEFASGRDAQVQVRGLKADGEAFANEIESIPVKPILKEGAIGNL